ncbi:conserved hypothetical protein [Acinetobacter sp. 8I-beige]|nr:conserved hypothetical protein [Acinetobacter sp. 8I-beige]
MLSLKIYKFVIFSIKNKSKVMGGTGLGGTGTGTGTGTEADNDKEKKPTQKFLSKSTSFTKDKS